MSQTAVNQIKGPKEAILAHLEAFGPTTNWELFKATGEAVAARTGALLLEVAQKQEVLRVVNARKSIEQGREVCTY
mgnify:CR=1 FL=1